MSAYTTNETNTQNLLLMKNLMEFYNHHENLVIMMRIINGESNISLRIVDWFVTNYAKNYYTVYDLQNPDTTSRFTPLKNSIRAADESSSKLPVTELHEAPRRGADSIIHRFKVYNEYKLKLKAYSKRQFDPFCRWERINIPFQNGIFMETTIGQLNFFKWAIESQVLKYIEENYSDIERDMNSRNSTSKRKQLNNSNSTVSSEDSLDKSGNNGKTRKKREELSVFPCKCIKKESVKIIVTF